VSGRASGVATDRPVALGRIVGVFGLAGWLKVQSYTEPVEAILDYPVWMLEAPAGLTAHRVCTGRRQKRQVVAQLESIGDRDAAQRWVGATIFVSRAELPPLEPREHYRDDLIGLTVRGADGVVLGRVDHFIDGPAYALMVVRGEREHWVPATPVYLRRVDIAQGEVHVDWKPLD
jgi:16S rRNA processing protein RimM